MNAENGGQGDNINKKNNPRLTAALAYAKRGWRVFPTRGKRPLTAHGFKDATTDPQQIAVWWALWPNANVAIATGAVSGLVIIDTDKKPDLGIDGEESLALLEKRYGALPETVQQITGGGGYQRFFLHPGVPVQCNANKLGFGVDVRGDGGLVIVPPSRHPKTGRTYEWEVLHHVDDVPLAPLPPAWIELLVTPQHLPQRRVSFALGWQAVS
jgi:hypothetical protein